LVMYTRSLHDALPICQIGLEFLRIALRQKDAGVRAADDHRPVELWIESLEFLLRQFRQLGRHLDVDVAGLADSDEVGLVVYPGQDRKSTRLNSSHVKI